MFYTIVNIDFKINLIIVYLTSLQTFLLPFVFLTYW
jgi:hypothetical protein